MEARLIDRIETGVELAAAALLGGAVGYAAFAWLKFSVPQPQLGACAGGAAALSFLACNRAMGILAKRNPTLPVVAFNVRDIEPMDVAELVLTDADRFDPDELLLTETDQLNGHVREDPLVLDDILAEIGPDARVVRLFDRKAMPTPGELRSRIDDHLGRASSAPSSPDASQALSDALADLRRSLR